MSGKQPWQMTRAEYLRKQDGFPELPPRTKLAVQGGLVPFDETVGGFHRQFVADAIRAGRGLTATVLADYPDLKPNNNPFLRRYPDGKGGYFFSDEGH